MGSETWWPHRAAVSVTQSLDMPRNTTKPLALPRIAKRSWHIASMYPSHGSENPGGVEAERPQGVRLGADHLMASDRFVLYQAVNGLPSRCIDMWLNVMLLRS